MSNVFGHPETSQMAIVELPEDAVSASWAPGVVAIAGNRITEHTPPASSPTPSPHQWWGSEISPATLNDAWITNGMSRYAELMYVQDASGSTAFQTAIGDVSAGALAYDTEPLSTSAASIFLPAVPVHDPRKGCHGLPHAPLGDGR